MSTLSAIAVALALAAPAAPPPPAPPTPAVAPVPPTAGRAWFGVFFGNAVDGGVEIIEVVPESPAARAGLTSGDLVIRVDGKDVADRRALSRALEGRTPGETVGLTILREGETKNAKVVLGTPPRTVISIPPMRVTPRPFEPGHGEASAAVVLGIGVGEIPTDLRKHLGGPDEAGLLVLKVNADGVAAKALRVGDLLVSVGGTPVATEDDLNRAVLDRSSGPVTLAGRRSKEAFTADVALRLKSPEQRAREARARTLESTIRQLEVQLTELKRQLAALTDAP